MILLTRAILSSGWSRKFAHYISSSTFLGNKLHNGISQQQSEEKPRALTHLLESPQHSTRHRARMYQLERFVRIIAECDGRILNYVCRAMTTRERMREVAHGGKTRRRKRRKRRRRRWSSSSPLGKCAVERSACTRHGGTSYRRFLFPPRSFSWHQCRFPISTS